MKEIVTIKIPVPVPEIKRFSRWHVLLSLFNPNSIFTTCEALKMKLYDETVEIGKLYSGSTISLRTFNESAEISQEALDNLKSKK